jgi:hypothetical protein
MTHSRRVESLSRGQQTSSLRGELMAWSIFTQGGGQGAAVTWAQDLLKALGVPQSSANVRFIYDWEESEGGGGKYNPLNQGPVPGHPELTTTGQQFGGGAADYASWQAGITGAVDYLHMQNYSGIVDALKTSNYAGAKSALIASPWAASHYGGGSTFSSATPPGAAPLGTGGGNVTTNAANTGLTIPGIPGLSVSGIVTDAINAVLKAFGLGSLKDMFERLGLIILGFALVIVGIHLLASDGGGGGGRQQTAASTNGEREEESEEATSSKISKPVRKTETTTATRGVGASEAVEAAAVA